MSWKQVIFESNESDAFPLSEQLEELGALSVSLEDAADQPLYEPELNTTPVWQQTLVIGLFEQDTDMQSLLRKLHEKFGDLPPYRLQNLEDQDWVRACMDDFKPMQFGPRLWICPSWETPPNPEAINIELDPGLAFGTGTHPTTALCLEWLDENQSLFIDQKVIDYGCGSGILAVAALKLQAKHAWGVDIEEQALIASAENAERNGVKEHLSLALAKNFPIDTQAQLVLANILANPLAALAASLAQHTLAQGYIVLSGILEEQRDMVVNAYQPWFEDFDIKIIDGWVRIAARRRS